MLMNKQELMTNVNEILDKHLANTVYIDPVLSITKSSKSNRTMMELEFKQGGIVLDKELFKLKDVIARIKGFDSGTQKVWLNEILNELGSDYGTLKYKAGYEQGKLEGEWVGQQLKDADKIRQELNKPVVKQFVADWLKYCKLTGVDLYHALEMGDLFYSNVYVQSREHTRKEIEAGGFGWVFDCPGIEIEEVD